MAPSAVNFVAFPRRFMTTWRRRSGSELISPTSGSSRRSSTPSSTIDSRASAHSSASVRRSTGCTFTSMCPASIRDRSRMSLMRLRRLPEEVSMLARLRCSRSSRRSLVLVQVSCKHNSLSRGSDWRNFQPPLKLLQPIFHQWRLKIFFLRATSPCTRRRILAPELSARPKRRGFFQ